MKGEILSNHCGYLHKLKRSQKVLLSQWNKRWFSIEGKVLKWYKTEAEMGGDCSGYIDLLTVTLEHFDSTTDFSFIINTPQRNMMLRASSATERDKWTRKLRMYADISRGGDGTNSVSSITATPSGTAKLLPSRSPTKGGHLDTRLEQALAELSSLSGEVRDSSVFTFGSSVDSHQLSRPPSARSPTRRKPTGANPYTKVNAANGKNAGDIPVSGRGVEARDIETPYETKGKGMRLEGGLVYTGRMDVGLSSRSGSDAASLHSRLSSASSLHSTLMSADSSHKAARFSSTHTSSTVSEGLDTTDMRFDSVSEIAIGESDDSGMGNTGMGVRSGRYAWG